MRADRAGHALELTDEQQAMLQGDRGPALRWAMTQQLGTARFFGAQRLIPAASAHVGAEMGIMGQAGLDLVARLHAHGARARVPSVTAACSVDFCRWKDFCLPQAHVAQEERLHGMLREMGMIDSSTCINYQTVSPPRFGEHLAWGDTGSVAFANGVVGARSNYEGGPASIAAALTGHVPEYGYHLAELRRATHIYEVCARLDGCSDWGALGALIGAELADYWRVPVIVVPEAVPTVDAFKHLAAALASFGSIAMFHVVGATPEARTLEDACRGDTDLPRRLVTQDDLAGVYARYPTLAESVDLVVFSAPQLSMYEVHEIVERLAGRRIAPHTRLVVTVNHQTQAELERLGYADRLHAAGADLLAGTCFYVMAPVHVRERFGFRTLVTPSAKLANIVGGAGYRPTLLPVADCVEAAVAGRAPGRMA